MIERPVMRWHGGKFRLAPWIIRHFPPHQVYLEPFAGAASVLMQKPRVAAECLNDLDDVIVNVFRVLRDPRKAEELRRRVALTPYARAEFDWAYDAAVDDVDWAHKSIVISFMGHGSDGAGRGYRTGFRCKMSDNRALSSFEWANWPQQIPRFVERLQGVAIEHRDALQVIDRLDTPHTLIYADPPYPHSTRTASRGRHGYRHEMTDDDHRRLSDALHAVDGMVIISGYACPLYDEELYSDWARDSCEALADRALPRTEVIWMNAACAGGQRQQRLIA